MLDAVTREIDEITVSVCHSAQREATADEVRLVASELREQLEVLSAGNPTFESPASFAVLKAEALRLAPLQPLDNVVTHVDHGSSNFDVLPSIDRSAPSLVKLPALRTLWVGYYPESLHSVKSIGDVFKQFGEVESCRIFSIGASNRPKFFAWVQFTTYHEAKVALSASSKGELVISNSKASWNVTADWPGASSKLDEEDVECVQILRVKRPDRARRLEGRQLYQSTGACGKVVDVLHSHGEAAVSIVVVGSIRETPFQTCTEVFVESRRASLGTCTAKVCKRVLLRNLPHSVQSDDLRQIFADIGQICFAVVHTRADGTSRGYGFLFLEHSEQVTHVLRVRWTIRGYEVEASLHEQQLQQQVGSTKRSAEASVPALELDSNNRSSHVISYAEQLSKSGTGSARING
eukprot:CAMPEP_0204301634 /NCGR_PEP_ID=MMETSP0468-20130131/80727_1 /ASSEMBLY_ACC=CAM_ASM_000383 /TAXON_ID=2969 /ORGANISM="Oxyrrhis marina" /LENGTH=406 /DNA_ID=CAMNT_0051280789 /DNA_START=99 /DNA_END=1319 /DNA_ORIENTATION=+